MRRLQIRFRRSCLLHREIWPPQVSRDPCASPQSSRCRRHARKIHKRNRQRVADCSKCINNFGRRRSSTVFFVVLFQGFFNRRRVSLPLHYCRTVGFDRPVEGSEQTMPRTKEQPQTESRFEPMDTSDRPSFRLNVPVSLRLAADYTLFGFSGQFRPLESTSMAAYPPSSRFLFLRRHPSELRVERRPIPIASSTLTRTTSRPLRRDSLCEWPPLRKHRHRGPVHPARRGPRNRPHPAHAGWSPNKYFAEGLTDWNKHPDSAHLAIARRLCL